MDRARITARDGARICVLKTLFGQPSLLQRWLEQNHDHSYSLIQASTGANRTMWCFFSLLAHLTAFVIFLNSDFHLYKLLNVKVFFKWWVLFHGQANNYLHLLTF